MRIRLITSLREFDALAPVWREVTNQGGQSSPFLSHDWFACCWRTAGPDRRREVWLLEDTAGPVALVPLVRWRTRIRGVPARAIRLMTCPEAPFTDIPLDGPADEVAEAFLGTLQARDDWEVLALPRLPANSRTVTALQAAFRQRFPWRVLGTEHSPVVTISGTWEAFTREIAPRLRTTWGQIGRALERQGRVTVEEHRAVDPEGPIFAEVLEISRQCWKGPMGMGLAAMQRMPRFFRELIRRASANDWLHLWVLRIDGRAVASEYQIGAGGWLHVVRADYDQALADLAPGTALSLRILRALFGRPGVRQYDLGAGTNGDTVRWATGARETVGFEVYASTAQGRLLHWIETGLVPVLQRWQAPRGGGDEGRGPGAEGNRPGADGRGRA